MPYHGYVEPEEIAAQEEADDQNFNEKQEITMEISSNQRSNIIYAIMHILLKKVDQEQGADDLIHALHVGDTDIAELRDIYKCISSRIACDLVEGLVNEISGEFEREEGELFNVTLTALKNLYDLLVESDDGAVKFAGELLDQNEDAIIRENVDANN